MIRKWFKAKIYLGPTELLLPIATLNFLTLVSHKLTSQSPKFFKTHQTEPGIYCRGSNTAWETCFSSGGSALQFQLFFQFQLPANVFPGRQEVMAPAPGLLPTRWETHTISGFRLWPVPIWLLQTSRESTSSWKTVCLSKYVLNTWTNLHCFFSSVSFSLFLSRTEILKGSKSPSQESAHLQTLNSKWYVDPPKSPPKQHLS